MDKIHFKGSKIPYRGSRSPSSTFDVSYSHGLTVGSDPSYVGFIRGSFGAVNPDTYKGLLIERIIVDSVGVVLIKIDDIHQDDEIKRLVINIEGYGYVDAYKINLEDYFESSTHAGLFTYLTNNIGNTIPINISERCTQNFLPEQSPTVPTTYGFEVFEFGELKPDVIVSTAMHSLVTETPDIVAVEMFAGNMIPGVTILIFTDNIGNKHLLYWDGSRYITNDLVLRNLIVNNEGKYIDICIHPPASEYLMIPGMWDRYIGWW